MTFQTPQKIGIIGLGLVGSALAKRLIQAHYQPLGYDLRAGAAPEFIALGGQWCADVQAMRSCELLILAVYQTADVEALMQTLFFDAHLSSEHHASRIIIDCSTGEPERLIQIAQRLKPLGIDFLEAPLSGSSQQIEAGQATMLLGGAPETIAGLASILLEISPKHIHAGGIGMGARAKLATNLVLGLNRAVLAEGIAFAESQGIAADKFLSMVLDSPARSEAAVVKGAKMVSGDFAPQSRIRQHLKDLEVMLDCASAADQGLPFTRQHAAILRASIAAGEGDLDNAAIVKQLRREKPG